MNRQIAHRYTVKHDDLREHVFSIIIVIKVDILVAIVELTA